MNVLDGWFLSLRKHLVLSLDHLKKREYSNRCMSDQLVLPEKDIWIMSRKGTGTFWKETNSLTPVFSLIHTPLTEMLLRSDRGVSEES